MLSIFSAISGVLELLNKLWTFFANRALRREGRDAERRDNAKVVREKKSKKAMRDKRITNDPVKRAKLRQHTKTVSSRTKSNK